MPEAIDRAVLAGDTSSLPELLAGRSLELLGELGLRLELREWVSVRSPLRC